MRVFVGVAWPYANGPFHIGHLAGAYLPGDIFARFHRLRGSEVLMVSGSDMHGTPILVRAETEGRSADEVSREFHSVNKEAFQRLGISFDLFTDTRTTIHERTVRELFLALLENGFVRRRTEENAFCPRHGRFLPDRYLTGECPHCHSPNARGDECDNCGRILDPKDLLGPKCRLDGTPAEFRPSEHFYLELDKLTPKITSYLADKKFWRPNVRGTVENFLSVGLRPTPITRDLDWGVPLPLAGYDTKRFYVWFDAVIGYLSAAREWAVRAGRPDAWRRFWDPDEQVHAYYFIGKDNIWFHAIVLPAILLGAGGFQTPFDVPANEWMRIEGGKISKSRSTTASAFIPELLKSYTPDEIRFYATQLAPQNHDTDFDSQEFDQLREEVLANQVGNLVQRVLVLTRDREAGKIPSPAEGWSAEPTTGVGSRIRTAHAVITREYDAVHLKEALDRTLEEVRAENRRIHDARPWQASETERRTTLYEALWLLKAIAIWLAPILPFTSAEIFRMLGYPEPPGRSGWEEALKPVPAGQPMGEIRPLFPREPPAAKESAGTSSPLVLELRAARILEAKNHPSADRLIVMTVDAGESTARTIVAGIRPAYAPPELVGRQIVLLANLEPRKIRGIASHGMLLAAEHLDRPTPLAPPKSAQPGALVDGVEGGSATITYDEFSRVELVVGRTESVADSETRVDLGGRKITVPGRWEIGQLVAVRIEPGGGLKGRILSFASGEPISVESSVPPGAKVR